MKNGITKSTFLIYFLIFATTLSAQSSSGSSSNIFIIALVLIAVLILVGVILQVADNLLRIEARQIGADKKGTNYSIFPRFSELFRPKLPKFVEKDKVVVLKEGHDILLEGVAKKQIDESITVSHFAMQPQNFIGISPIPKVMGAIGDTVKAGDPLFFDKKKPEVKYAAPVSGEIIAINRGAKRAITEIVILADKEQSYRTYDTFDLDGSSRSDLVNYLLDSGIWPMIRQRPFNVVADPADTPKAVFISTFDTAPLAPDLNLVVAGREAAFAKGLEVLRKLSNDKVHLGLNAKGDKAPTAAFSEAEGVSKHWFHGQHPAGNVGVQIHHVAPLAGNEKIWTLGVQEVVSLGTLFAEGRFDAERVVALTGAELDEPKYVRTRIGASIESLVKDNVTNDHVRYISGDVLSGEQKALNSFINFYDDQITIVEEGDYYEPFGWLLPISPRPSISPSIPTSLISNLRYKANTNTHGEQRAFVVTGQYEKVLPMDIYLQHLMKSIIINDFERMEGLGLAELVEEDVALAEFVCTSKQPLQQILRKGLDILREQS